MKFPRYRVVTATKIVFEGNYHEAVKAFEKFRANKNYKRVKLQYLTDSANGGYRVHPDYQKEA